MSVSAVGTARKLLDEIPGNLEMIFLGSFSDDQSAHADDLQAQLESDCLAEFEAAQEELSQEFGPPITTQDNDVLVPLSGVFRVAVWLIVNRRIYLAAAHEDRETPYLLMLGTVP